MARSYSSALIGHNQQKRDKVQRLRAEGLKYCNKCKTNKCLSVFTKSNAAFDGLQSACTACQKTRHYNTYREDIAASRAKSREKAACRRPIYKQLAIAAYGEFCYCCGEDNIGLLTLDHKNEDGHLHRKEIKLEGAGFYAWLKKNNYPQDLGLRVACYNCNCGRRGNGGICPHETSKQLLRPCSVINLNQVVTRGGASLKHSKQKAA